MVNNRKASLVMEPMQTIKMKEHYGELPILVDVASERIIQTFSVEIQLACNTILQRKFRTEAIIWNGYRN